MSLPTAGPISFADIQTEFGGVLPIALNEYYAGGANVPPAAHGPNGSIPTNGAIDLLKFYGSSNIAGVLSGVWDQANFTLNASATLSSTALPIYMNGQFWTIGLDPDQVGGGLWRSADGVTWQRADLLIGGLDFSYETLTNFQKSNNGIRFRCAGASSIKLIETSDGTNFYVGLFSYYGDWAYFADGYYHKGVATSPSGAGTFTQIITHSTSADPHPAVGSVTSVSFTVSGTNSAYYAGTPPTLFTQYGVDIAPVCSTGTDWYYKYDAGYGSVSALYKSTDHGGTVTLAASITIQSIGYFSSTGLLAVTTGVSTGKPISTSVNGVSWTPKTITGGTAVSITQLATNGVDVAVAFNTNSQIVVSTDGGLSWKMATIPFQTMSSLKYSGGRFWAFDSTKKLWSVSATA